MKKKFYLSLILIFLVSVSLVCRKHYKKITPYFTQFHNYITKPTLKARIINNPGQTFNGNNIGNFALFKEILEEKYYFKTTEADDYDLVITGTDGNTAINNKKAFKVFYVGEPVPAKLKGFDLALGFDYLEDHQNYMRLPVSYIFFPTNFLKEKINTSYKRETECNPNKTYFACFLVTNPINKERIHLFHRLSLYKHVASGGAYLNNIGGRFPQEETMGWLEQCKFVIAYENTANFPGYITEKIFRAYYAGAIPLYSTHPTAQRDINQKAIISAQNFASEEDMVNYIIEVDQDDKKYCEIWNQPLVIDPSLNYENVKARLRKKLAPLLMK